MKPSPMVSVVMPVHNTAQYVREAVGSILGQSLQDFEFIMIDDGSTDGSAEILDSYQEKDGRVRIFHQDNNGIAAALNKGIELARGKYVARMDSDDISLPERLAKQVALMESNPEVGICGTACRLFGDNCGITKPKTESEEIKSWLLFGPCMAHPTVMMRRQLIVDKHLYYDPWFKQAEDYELWVRFSQHCEMANIPEPLLLYRVCDKQATTQFRPEVHRWSGFVHKQAMKVLGIEPSDAELELHLSLHALRFHRSREYVERVEAWLCKLLDANNAAKAFHPEALSRVVFEFWRYVCAADCELGLWIWRKFRKSELTRDCRTACRRRYGSLAWLCLKTKLSKTLGKTRAGRSLKRLVHGSAFGH